MWPKSVGGDKGKGRRKGKWQRKRNHWSFTPGQALRKLGPEFRASCKAVCGPRGLGFREMWVPGRVRVRSALWVLGRRNKGVEPQEGDWYRT